MSLGVGSESGVFGRSSLTVLSLLRCVCSSAWPAGTPSAGNDARRVRLRAGMNPRGPWSRPAGFVGVSSIRFKFKAKVRKSRQQWGMRVVDSGGAATACTGFVAAGAVGYPGVTREDLEGTSLQPGTHTDTQAVREDRRTAESEAGVPGARILRDGDGGWPDTADPRATSTGVWTERAVGHLAARVDEPHLAHRGMGPPTTRATTTAQDCPMT
jgi:hypothetical protein